MRFRAHLTAPLVLHALLAPMTGCADRPLVLAHAPDLGVPQDLSAAPDLAVGDDLSRRAPTDLAAPPDLAPVPVWSTRAFGRAIMDVWASGPHDIYVTTGASVESPDGSGAVMLHSNGDDNWTIVPSPVTNKGYFTSLHGASAHDFYVSWTAWSPPSTGGILHGNGDGQWTSQSAIATQSLFILDATHLFAATPGHFLFSSGDGNWSDAPPAAGRQRHRRLP
jgi:hypothetical protein